MAGQPPTVFHRHSLPSYLQRIPKSQSNFQLSSTGTAYHILSIEFHNGKATSNCLPLVQFTTISPKNSTMAGQPPTVFHWHSLPHYLQLIPQWQSNFQLSSTGTVYKIFSKEFFNGRATSNCLPPLAQFTTFSPKNSTMAKQLPTVFHWHSLPHSLQRIPRWQSNSQLSSTCPAFQILSKGSHNGRATSNLPPLVQFSKLSPKNPTMAVPLPTVLYWPHFPHSLQRILQWQTNFQLSSTGTAFQIYTKEFNSGKATSNCLPLAQFTTFSPKNSTMAKQLPTFLHWPSFPNSLQRILQ